MKTKPLFHLIAFLSFINQLAVYGATRYVNLNSANPIAPYTSWGTAATNIQDAVEAAVDGDDVLVTNGVYASGGRAVVGIMTNRVAVYRPLNIHSVNGRALTVIQGYQVAGTTNGDGAIRCVYLTNGASLSGFTLTNGATRNLGDYFQEQCGGGVFSDTNAGPVSNCVVAGDSAYGDGSGVYGARVNNCTLNSNSAMGSGGGAYYSTLNSCTLSGNSAGGGGGGAAGCTLSYCIVTGNLAHNGGGGATEATLNNCVVSSNAISGGFGGGVYGGVLNNCTVVRNQGGGAHGYYWGHSGDFCTVRNSIVYYNFDFDVGSFFPYFVVENSCVSAEPSCCQIGHNTTNAPSFLDLARGNLRLQSNSPCINAGTNDYVVGSTDLDGRPRIVGGTVDIGAYEYQPNISGQFIGWLQQYGLPTDGSADYADTDGDGRNNWQEWRCQTIPTSALSVLRMISAVRNGNDVNVTWQSVGGVSYFLERSTNLAGTPFVPLATNIPGQAGLTSYSDGSAADTNVLFYRVGVGN